MDQNFHVMDYNHPTIPLNNSTGTLEQPAENDPPTANADSRSLSVPNFQYAVPLNIEIKEEPQSPEFLEEDFGNNGIFVFDKEVPNNIDESSENFAVPLLQTTLQNQLIENERANFNGISENIYNGALPPRETINYDIQNGPHSTLTQDPSPLPDVVISAGVKCFDIVEKSLSKSLREQFETYYNESMDYTDNTPIGSLWEIYKGIRAFVEEETNSPHRSIYSNVETEIPKQKTSRRKTISRAKSKMKFGVKPTVAEKCSTLKNNYKLISGTSTSLDCRNDISNKFSNAASIEYGNEDPSQKGRPQVVRRSLNFKIEILNRKGESATKLGREYNISEATVRGYRKNELKIRNEYAKKCRKMENLNQPIKKEPLESSDETVPVSYYGRRRNYRKREHAKEQSQWATHKVPKKILPLPSTLPTEHPLPDAQPEDGKRRRFYSLDTKLRVLAMKNASPTAVAREFGLPVQTVLTIRSNEGKIMKMAGSPLKTPNIPKIKEENPTPLMNNKPLPQRRVMKIAKPNFYKGTRKKVRPRENCSLELKLEILNRKHISSDILSKEYGLKHYTIENIKKSKRHIMKAYNRLTQNNSLEKQIKQEKKSDDENCDPNYMPSRRKRKKRPSLKMRKECSEACAHGLTRTVSKHYEAPSLKKKIDVLNRKGMSYGGLAKEFGLSLKEVTSIKKCEKFLRGKFATLQKENKMQESGFVSALKKMPGPLPAEESNNLPHRKNRRKHQKPKFNPVPLRRRKSFLTLEQKIDILNRRNEPFVNLAKDYGITVDDLTNIKKSAVYYRMRYSKLMGSKSNGDLKMGEAVQVKTEPMVLLPANSDVSKLIGQKTWSQYCQENRHKRRCSEKKRPLEQDNNFVGFPDTAQDSKDQDYRLAKRRKIQRELVGRRITRNSPKMASNVSTKFDKLMCKPVVILEKLNMKEVQLSLLNNCRKIHEVDDKQTVKENETTERNKGKVKVTIERMEEEDVIQNEEKLEVSENLESSLDNLEEEEIPQENEENSEESEGKLEDKENGSSDEIKGCQEKTKVDKKIGEIDKEMDERDLENAKEDEEIGEERECEANEEEHEQRGEGDSFSFEGFEKQASPSDKLPNSVSYKVNGPIDAYCDKALTTTDMIDEYLKISDISFPHLDVPENSIVDSLNLASNGSSNESQIHKQCSNQKVKNNETDLQFSLWDYVSRSGSNAECNHSSSSASQCLNCSYYRCDSDVSLQNRVETHTGNEIFKCSYCNYSCSDNYFLRFHELNHHSTQISEC